MNSYLAKTAQAWILITRPRLVSPRPGLRTIANTENIINNTNNTTRLQPADSTETGADHLSAGRVARSVERNGVHAGSVFEGVPP